MKHAIAISGFSFFCVLLLSAVTASAQALFVPPSFTISAGYSNLQLQKPSGNLFYDHNGGYVDADVAFPLPIINPIQLGFGITSTGFSDRESLNDLSNGQFNDPFDHLYSDVGLFEIEPRVGFRLGGHQGFYALPRIGAGLLIDSYAIDQTASSNGATYINTQYHTGAAVELRPALQVGFAFGPFEGGLEGSYSYAWGDFGQLGHAAQELRIGAFFTFRF